MKRVLTQLDSCCFIAFFSVIQAIPIQEVETDFGKASNDTQNVCIHENKIYKEGQNLSTSNPCETCVCDPPGFSCSLNSCDLKPGCKAIHKANRCCPEYVCECERNGKIYGNGEKVEEANPCKVCYCKGGEIKCALVTCYTRDDCEPGYVAGVCCPKYDHCPPLEVMKNKSTSPAPAQVIISDLKTETAPVRDRMVEVSTTTNGYSGTVSREFSTTEQYLSKENITFAEENVTSTEYYQMRETEANATEGGGDMFTTESEAWTEVTSEVTTDETTDDFLTTTEEEFNVTGKEETATTAETLEISTSDVTTTEGATEASTTTEGATSYETEGLESTAEATSTTEQTWEYTSTEFTNSSLRSEPEISTALSETTTTTTEIPVEEVSNVSIIQVIVPKTMKKDLDQLQSSIEGPAPIVVRISAEQIQFLKLAEEPPVYVENHESGERKIEQLGVVVVPKTTPTTVEMVKVVEGSLTGEVNSTAEIAAKSVNNSFSFNNTDFIQER